MGIFDKIRAWFSGPAASEAPEAGAEAPEADAEPHGAAASANGREDASPAAAKRSNDAGTSAARARPVTPVPGEARPRRRTTPDRDARLERDVRSLLRERQPTEAIELLQKHVRLLARHERGALPCLCRRCIRPELEAFDGASVPFVRDFVIVRGRALFYWMPAELAPRARQVRASMRATLRLPGRAFDLDADPRPPKTRINPFTRQAQLVPEPQPHRPTNPFTGKAVR